MARILVELSRALRGRVHRAIRRLGGRSTPCRLAPRDRRCALDADALAQLNRGRDAHVLELVDAIEIKDAATLGHVSRVSAYALAIGRRIGLQPGELRNLVLAAQMHDVGKIGVPDSLLLSLRR